jgi:hypothetical protein
METLPKLILTISINIIGKIQDKKITNKGFPILKNK